MTFVGKILVLVNLAMACVFMAFALMVFTARTEVNAKLAKEKLTATDIRTRAGNVESELTNKVKRLEDELASVRGQKDDADKKLATLNDDLTRRRDENDKLRSDKAALESQTKAATTEQKQRNEEVKLLRGQVDELVERNNKLTNEKIQLQDEKSTLSNQLELVQGRRDQLQTRVAQLENFVVKVNRTLPSEEELEAEGGVSAPPDVEGIVKKVDEKGRCVISLGEDQGIRKGHELQVWRTDNNPKYLGVVRVFTTEASIAVAIPVSVVGVLKPGDKVGSRIQVNK